MKSSLQKGKLFLLLGVLLIVFLALPVWLNDKEQYEFSPALRAGMDGHFVELEYGFVNYQDQGPKDGEPVLLISGISLPRVVWQENIAPLVDAGYRVISFDLYGRGMSDRPKADYSPAFYNSQITQLLTKLNISKPAHIVGLAYGGLLAVKYAEQQPEYIKSMSLICPDGLGTEFPFYARMMRWPLVGEHLGVYLLKAFGDGIFAKRLQRYTDAGASMGPIQTQFERSMAFKGIKRAIVSSVRHTPVLSADTAFRKLASTDIPVQVIWGKADPITPVSISERAMELLPDAELNLVEAGHLPHYEEPQVVNQLLLKFLGRSLQAEMPASVEFDPLAKFQE